MPNYTQIPTLKREKDSSTTGIYQENAGGIIPVVDITAGEVTYTKIPTPDPANCDPGDRIVARSLPELREFLENAKTYEIKNPKQVLREVFGVDLVSEPQR